MGGYFSKDKYPAYITQTLTLENTHFNSNHID